MMHMNLRGSTEWFIRIVSIYLFLFWVELYLGFSLNIEVGPLALIDIVKALILGAVCGIPLFAITLMNNSLLNRIMAFFLMVMVFFYGFMATEKLILPYFIGIVSHIVGLIYLFKFKLLGRKL